MADVPPYIREFLETVYPGAADLAMATFDERTALVDATTTIRALRTKLTAVKHNLGGANEALIFRNTELCAELRSCLDALGHVEAEKTITALRSECDQLRRALDKLLDKQRTKLAEQRMSAFRRKRR